MESLSQITFPKHREDKTYLAFMQQFCRNLLGTHIWNARTGVLGVILDLKTIDQDLYFRVRYPKGV